MSTALVVLTSDDPKKQLLSAANRYVSGTETELIVCRCIDEIQYQSDLQRKAESGEETPSIDDLERSARDAAAEVAKTAFGDDVEYTAIGIVGDLHDDILRMADQHGCDHVFVTGKKRSPTGKVLFGDIAQSIILDFDGPVTVTTEAS